MGSRQIAAWRVCGVLALATAAIAVATGCGSDDSSDGESSGSASANVDEAQALVDQLGEPTAPAVSEPLSKTPPEGLEVVYLQCGLPVCETLGDHAEEAASDLGWTLTRIDAGLTPDTVAAAYQKAADANPDAVLGAPTPRAAYETVLAGWKQDGVPYVQIGDTGPIGDGIIASVPGRPGFVGAGNAMAAYVVADSDGKANAVLFRDDQFSVLKLAGESFVTEYERLCPDCPLDQQAYSSTDIGQGLPGQVVSYVQAHPDVDYVAFVLASATSGVPAALIDAGLGDRVKIVSRAGDPLNFASIVGGQVETATVAESSVDNGYRAIDALARSVNGDSLECCDDEGIVSQLLTAENIEDPDQPFTGGDIAEHYRQLWGLN